MVVSREDLERSLADVAARVDDPRAGIYGPGSASWTINREAVVMLGGGCAALLQLAHPFVAHAVDQHSKTQSDPLGRFRRTFANVFAMVFGDLDHALARARKVHDIHTRIRGVIREDIGAYARGSRYLANDEDALFWVHVTLVHTAARVYDLVVRPLDELERDRYYRESRVFARLFGIPDRVMPGSWRELDAYFDAMVASDTIRVGEPALRLRRFLLQPPRRVHGPSAAWFAVWTAGLLPPKLRSQFELPFGPREEAVFRASVPLLRAAQRIAPPRLRWFPAYVEARRRVRGEPPRDRVGRLLERIALKAIEPDPAILTR